MKLATIITEGHELVVLVRGDGAYIDLAAMDPSLPASVLGLIRAWPDVEQRLKALEQREDATLVPDQNARLVAPMPEPVRDIICVGKNYHEHATEFFKSGFDSSSGGRALPPYPVIFTKATGSVAGPNDDIPLWRDPTGTTDYEGELGVVIGKDGYGIEGSTWREHVFGYTIINDVTSRELQKRHQQWFIGKGIDGFCPMGPWVVTSDEFGEPGDQILETYVNDELRQRAPVSSLIFDIPTLIESISRHVSLKAGDIIATGTPAGVGIGFNPARYLSHGDRVRISITGLGMLENVATGKGEISGG